jgi:hypothetical protein
VGKQEALHAYPGMSAATRASPVPRPTTCPKYALLDSCPNLEPRAMLRSWMQMSELLRGNSTMKSLIKTGYLRSISVGMISVIGGIILITVGALRCTVATAQSATDNPSTYFGMTLTNDANWPTVSVGVTSSSFCTTASERVYITTNGCEIGFVGTPGLQAHRNWLS